MNLLIGYYISRYFLLKPGSTSLFICPLPWLKAELRQGNALPTPSLGRGRWALGRCRQGIDLSELSLGPRGVGILLFSKIFNRGISHRALSFSGMQYDILKYTHTNTHTQVDFSLNILILAWQIVALFVLKFVILPKPCYSSDFKGAAGPPYVFSMSVRLI